MARDSTYLTQGADAAAGTANVCNAAGADGDGLAISELAESVISATGPNANPRMSAVTACLVRHLHAFAREVDLTSEEWMAGVEFINQMGLLSPVRNETQLLCDVLGFESLVDHLDNNRKRGAATLSAILGPFYKDAPIRAVGDSIASSKTNAAHSRMTARVRGRVTCAETGTPIAGALVDIWHADPDGNYEGQGNVAALEKNDLRGVFESASDGRYEIYCLRPGPYPIPDDGPVGHLLRLLDRHSWRPAHIHFKVSALGFSSLTTQLFDSEGEHLREDAVFAVKEGLVIRFSPIDDDPRARFAVDYDFKLRKAEQHGVAN